MEQVEKRLLSAVTVKPFLSLQLVSLGWGRGKEREGGLLEMSGPLLCSLVPTAGEQFSVFSAEVAQAAQCSAHSAGQINPETCVLKGDKHGCFFHCYNVDQEWQGGSEHILCHAFYLSAPSQINSLSPFTLSTWSPFC